MLKTKTVRTGAAALLLVGAVGFGPGLASVNAAPQKSAAATKSITEQGQAWNYTGTWTDKQGRSGVAHVSIVPKSFFNDGDRLMMRSAVTTTLEGARGSVPHTKKMNLQVQDVTSGTAASGVTAASCDILNLVLGPLDLNILGLEVHLDQVVLDIVATTGAGNLLGNLLCAVAGLLDGGAVPGPDRWPAPADPGHPQRARGLTSLKPLRQRGGGTRAHPGCHHHPVQPTPDPEVHMTVIAFRPRRRGSRTPPRARPRRGRDLPVAEGRMGRMQGSLRVQRLVVVPRGAFVTGVFTGELRDVDGSLVGVDSRRATAAADLVRDDGGFAPVVRPFQLDLMGLAVDVAATPCSPPARGSRGPSVPATSFLRAAGGGTLFVGPSSSSSLPVVVLGLIIPALQRTEEWMLRGSRPHPGGRAAPTSSPPLPPRDVSRAAPRGAARGLARFGERPRGHRTRSGPTDSGAPEPC